MQLQVKRTEQKLLINQRQRIQLVERLEKIMPRDIHCPTLDGYEIRSLYFDTLSDRCCVEKDDGLLVHEKIRIRIYGTDDRVIKLESKRKVGEYQVKKSMLIDRSTLEALCQGNYTVLLTMNDPNALYFYRKLSDGMFPRAIIQYQRLSYALDTNNTRLTFDFNIRATECCMDLFQEPLLAHPILPADRIILEVKYNNFLFGYIKDALRDLNASPASFSKYFAGRSFYRRMV